MKNRTASMKLLNFLLCGLTSTIFIFNSLQAQSKVFQGSSWTRIKEGSTKGLQLDIRRFDARWKSYKKSEPWLEKKYGPGFCGGIPSTSILLVLSLIDTSSIFIVSNPGKTRYSIRLEGESVFKSIQLVNTNTFLRIAARELIKAYDGIWKELQAVHPGDTATIKKLGRGTDYYQIAEQVLGQVVSGRHKGMIERCGQLRKMDTDPQLGTVISGYASLLKGDYKAAESHFESISDTVPLYGISQYCLSLIYKKTNQHEKQFNTLGIVIKSDKSIVEGHRERGLLYQKLGNCAAAKNDLNRFIELSCSQSQMKAAKKLLQSCKNMTR